MPAGTGEERLQTWDVVPQGEGADVPFARMPMMLGVQEVASSNLAGPTSSNPHQK